jgi:Dyp-type peroxidase family
MTEPLKRTNFEPPLEPVLPLDDIQGIVVPGFLKQHQTLLAIAAPKEKGKDGPAKLRRFVREFWSEVSTGAETLDDRRIHRAAKSAGRPQTAKKPLVAIAFTYTGLSKTTPGASSLPSDAFRQGLAARSAYLGDPTGPNDEGNPLRWKVGAPGSDLDALIIVAGDTRPLVDAKVSPLKKKVARAGLKVVYFESGAVRPDLPGHEHFGFDDGVSQPGIRGRASTKANDFITPRHIAKTEQPANSLFGYPGQDLVWPGVLVLGHPATSPDPVIPGQPSATVPAWSLNGSYLVFRRLRQDVGLFWRTMRLEAKHLSSLPGFEKMTDEKLASRIVGRWPSGAPVNRVPQQDDPVLGKKALANNHFRFDSDESPLALTSGYQDKFPQSKADPAGITCPWAAHIRKVNTRDSASDTGGRDSTYIRRLLRVGIPFGKPLKNRYASRRDDPQHGERGLLFLSIQGSIEDQFEFLMVRWMGDPSRPKMPGGHDLLVGQNDALGQKRERRCVIFGSGVEQARVATDAQWIVPTGGGYFFVPSITALRDVIAAGR